MVAPGYEKAVENVHVIGSGGGEIVYVTLQPNSSSGEATSVLPRPPILAPKAQRELGKALLALRAGKLVDARKHLDAVYHLAPSHPDVNFLFGVYSSQVNDWQQAKSYWEKAIAFYPQHLLAQISLGDALLRENKPADAIPHLKKALEIDPNSWRAYTFLADAALFSNCPPEVDEKVPPVESGIPCEVNEVVQNAGKRLQEFIRNVDHFTATESLFHESMNAWGFPDAPQTRKFDYVVSIQEVRPGILTAYEYREGDLSYQRFPGGVASLGLPALVLIFHRILSRRWRKMSSSTKWRAAQDGHRGLLASSRNLDRCQLSMCSFWQSSVPFSYPSVNDGSCTSVLPYLVLLVR